MTTNVSFFGDSFSFQLGTLSDYFGDEASGWVNNGVGGDLTYVALARITDVNPAVVGRCVVLLGINDIYGGAGTGGERLDLIGPGTVTNGFASSSQYLTTIYQNLRGRGIAVFPCTLPPLTRDAVAGVGPRTAAQMNAQVLLLNAWITAYAAANRLTLIDYYTAFADANGWSDESLINADGLHPNTAGRALSTSVAGAALRGSVWYTKSSIALDVPTGSGDTVVAFRGDSNGLSTLKNWTLKAGSWGYSGTGMADAALVAIARTQGRLL